VKEMTARKYKVGRAFTLVEVMVTTLAALVLIIGVSAMLAHGHLGYRRLFNRVNSDVVRNAYEARRTFDRIVRKSHLRRHDPDDPGSSAPTNEICVYYYLDPESTPVAAPPDRYARFYLTNWPDGEDDTELVLAQGPVAFATLPVPGPSMPPLPAPDSTIVLAHNVTVPVLPFGIFSVRGASVRMELTLSNEDPAVNRIETLEMTVTATAIRHNDW
jgi:hypothetical protein